MTGMLQVQNGARMETDFTDRNADDKSAYPRTGLLQEQRFTCANHSNEDITLVQIGWQNFSCPKCGKDYSIGRKIAIQKLNQCFEIYD